MDYGDSLIVAGNNHKARIYIHSNYPENVMSILRNKGSIVQQKADDMRRQYESSFVRKYNIALVTDSIADLPQELIDKHQIHMIPLNINMRKKWGNQFPMLKAYFNVFVFQGIMLFIISLGPLFIYLMLFLFLISTIKV